MVSFRVDGHEIHLVDTYKLEGGGRGVRLEGGLGACKMVCEKLCYVGLAWMGEGGS